MQVLIVTGGDTGYPDYLDLSSTETWTRSSTRWTPAADLPSPRHSLRGVSFGGHFIVTGEHIAILTHSIKVLLLCEGGGYYGSSFDYSSSTTLYSDVLMYDPETGAWIRRGDLQTPRVYHEATTVKWDDIAPFCNQ